MSIDILKIKTYIKKYGVFVFIMIILEKLPIAINNFMENLIKINIANEIRITKNNIADLFPRKEPNIVYLNDEKSQLKFPDKKSYRNQLKYYFRKKQYFDEYINDKYNPPKKYIDIKIGAYLQCYNQQKASLETIKSFRKFFPDSPIKILSDGGQDFSQIAKKYNCKYEYSTDNIKFWPCLDILAWFKRLKNVCEEFSDCDWIILLEDDVRIRDYISKFPSGHLCGQNGGNNLKKGKQISKKAKKYLLSKYPEIEINGISGCGGSIFHRQTFLECYENISNYDVESLKKLDDGLSWATDFAITFLFLMNNKLVRRWLDFSEERTKNFGPAAAVDHQFKNYYKLQLTEEDKKLLEIL